MCNTSKIIQDLAMSVLFADGVVISSDREANLQEVCDKWTQILENHGLSVRELKTEHVPTTFSDQKPRR